MQSTREEKLAVGADISWSPNGFLKASSKRRCSKVCLQLAQVPANSINEPHLFLRQHLPHIIVIEPVFNQNPHIIEKTIPKVHLDGSHKPAVLSNNLSCHLLHLLSQNLDRSFEVFI